MKGFFLGWLGLWIFSNLAYAGVVQNLFYSPEQLLLGFTTLLFGGLYGYTTWGALCSYTSHRRRLAGRWMLIGCLVSLPIYALYPYVYQEAYGSVKIDPASTLPVIWGFALLATGTVFSLLRE